MFSYREYRKIVEIVKESGRSCNFSQALDRERFIIMRHDVEFSVERAFALSRLEDEMDFTSTYFFQLTNNSYNLLSRQNQAMLRQMKENGHVIGLHYATNGMTDMGQIREQIQKEIRVMSEMLEMEITAFSVHRPTKDILRENIKLPGVLNAYQDSFFTFAEQVTQDTPLEVRYFSDAQHRWNYGLVPDRETIEKYDKVQILTHPYSWTAAGHENEENFRTLIAEHRDTFVETIGQECNHFAAVRDRM